MLGNVIDSVTTFFAYKHDLIQSIGAWFYGDFSMIVSGRYEMMYITIPLIITAYLYADRFTIAGMGEEFSANLGLNYRQVVNIGMVIVALVTAAVILTVGVIPFLGLIIPNIVTLLRGDHLRQNLFFTALLGRFSPGPTSWGGFSSSSGHRADRRDHRQRGVPVPAVEESGPWVIGPN